MSVGVFSAVAIALGIAAAGRFSVAPYQQFYSAALAGFQPLHQILYLIWHTLWAWGAAPAEGLRF